MLVSETSLCSFEACPSPTGGLSSGQYGHETAKLEDKETRFTQISELID